MQNGMGMELWAIVPELTLAVLVLFLLPLGSLLPTRLKYLVSWIALGGVLLVGVESLLMLNWRPQAVFLGTYAVDPFAVYFKLFAVVATGCTLLATQSHFRNHPHEGHVPPLLLIACLGIILLAASQDLALIALFIQLVTAASYILVGLAKENRFATEAALKMFLYAASVGAVMIYGMVLLFGLTGSLRLPELATRLHGVPVVIVLTIFLLILVGYGFEVTLVPFHMWVPDTYQGAPTPLAGFLSVGPKAAGLAVLLRTLVVAFPHNLGNWSVLFAILAAITMSVGNLFALRQSSVKRLLAYSSIGQVGYLLVGVATAAWSALAISGMLTYLTVYLFMNLGAFLAVDAFERQLQTDDLASFAGLGRRSPFVSLILAVCVLALAGFPPLGSFVGKTMLFGALLERGWVWLAVIMVLNITLSLYYYVRILVQLYLYPTSEKHLSRNASGLSLALLLLGVGVLLSGILPEVWIALAAHASLLWKG